MSAHNPITALGAAEHVTATAAGKALGTELVASIRAGGVTAEQLAAELRRIALNDFAQADLIGIAAVLIDELTQGVAR